MRNEECAQVTAKLLLGAVQNMPSKHLGVLVFGKAEGTCDFAAEHT